VAAHSEARIKITSLPSHDVFERFYKFSYDTYSVMRKAFYDVYPALIPRHPVMGLRNVLAAAGISEPALFFPEDERSTS
jgi:hypothetical protein